MRKKTISYIADNFMWYLIYLLPIFAYLILLFKGGDVVTLSSAMSSCGLDILTTSDIFTTFSSIFGSTGVVPLFTSPDILMYFCYFVCVYLGHLAVDFLLFIPRIAHKWLNKLYGSDD